MTAAVMELPLVVVIVTVIVPTIGKDLWSMKGVVLWIECSGLFAM
jgi:hypothetical protein